MRYAIVKNGEVINIIEWDGLAEYLPAENCDVYDVVPEVSIGWTFVNEEFVAPDPPILPEEPTEDPAITEAKEAASQELMALGISEANARIIVGLPPL